MLDVHPPHESAHSWKDFFIHIATIVVGLLIAIGLEQTVEWIHRRHLLVEAREVIATELDDNRRILKKNLEQVATIEAELNHDMALLREHQATRKPLSEKLDYSWIFYRTPDAAWQAIRENGSLALMPYDELQTDVYVYTVFASVMEAATVFNTSIEVAGAIARRSADGTLSAHDTEELISATSDALGKLAFTHKLLTFEGMGLQADGPVYLRPDHS